MVSFRAFSPPPACLLLLVITRWHSGYAQLSEGYYASSCPTVENVVSSFLLANLFSDITAPAALVRLAFHDCQVQGCDASIMLDSGPGISAEIGAAANLGIRHLDIINRIKAILEGVCPNTVSCADIIAMAGRDAINLSGGPRIVIPLGRRDGTTASSALAQSTLPPAAISVDGMLQLFGGMGMSTSESVAILGSHTIGVAHCANFVNRLFPTADVNMGPLFYDILKARCPPQYTSGATLNLDLTLTIFDNQYFRTILNGRGLLTIDSEISMDARTAPIVTQFASDKNLFFQAFSSAYIKMTSHNVLTGAQGQIRQNCGTINPI